ncbi:unnamed protein product, partial [Mesorhabditis belari]|uniref:Periplasmic heavy metal sensor n=1 Tax=Mesorhabditis belari TaxID=2138241 RepID=A0AAF3F1H5_9BILA
MLRYFFFVFFLGWIESRIATEAETKSALNKLLEQAGEMSIVEINAEVERIISLLPEGQRREHMEMRKYTFAEERERQIKIRETLPQLSVKAQQRLVRIIMVQEHKQLTQNEKRRRLNYIKQMMNPQIADELAKHFTQQQLYRLAF